MVLVKLQVRCRVNCSPCNTLLLFFSISLILSAVEGNLLIRQKQKKQVDRHYFLPRKTSLRGACKSRSHCSCKQFRTSPPPTFYEIYISYKVVIYIEHGRIYVGENSQFSNIMTTFATQIGCCLVSLAGNADLAKNWSVFSPGAVWHVSPSNCFVWRGCEMSAISNVKL